MRGYHFLIVGFLAAQLAACSSNDLAEVVGISTITMYGGRDTLLVGESKLLDAEAFDANGDPVTGATFTYTSSAPSIAMVSSDGVVTALAVGSATITASTGGIDKTMSVVVASMGRVAGRVYDAVTQAPIANANVSFIAGFGGQGYGSVTTHDDGSYLSPPIATSGAVTVTVTAAGYITAGMGTVFAPFAATAQVEPIPMVPNSSGTGGISGTVRDARTAQGIAGMHVSVINEGLRGSFSGTVTASDGSFQFTGLAAGTYTLTSGDTSYAYTTAVREAVVIGNAVTANQDLVMSASGQHDIRIVLTWGVNPADLDAHLTGPDAGGSRFHVYYASRGSTTSAPFAGLDVDNTHSYGPETITITQTSAGTYRFSVHDYTNRDSSYTTALSTSGARVDVYYEQDGYQRQQSFYPPQVSGTLWTVFEMSVSGGAASITAVGDMSYVSSSYAVSLRAPGATVATDADLIGAALREHLKGAGH